MTIHLTTALAGHRRLTPQQRQLIATFAGERCMPCSLIAIRSDVGFDPGKLRADLSALVSRHDALRTRFVTLPGLALPVQQHDASMGYSLEVTGDEDVIAAASGELPSDRPALRVVCGEHILAITIPVSLADSRSLDLILAAISLTDAAGVSESDAAGGEATLEVMEGDQERDWWLQQRRPPVVLPFRRGELTTGFSQTPPQEVPSTLSAQIATVVQNGRATTQSFWLAAWWLLLRRIADEDLSIEVEFDGRTRVELEDRVGPLARRAPLAFALHPDQSFLALVQQVSAVLDHGREIQEHVDPVGGLSGAVGFAWREVLVPLRGRYGQLTQVRRYVPYGREALDLCLEHTPEGNLSVSITSDAAFVAASDALLLREQLFELVATAAAHPEVLLSRLPVGPSAAINLKSVLPTGVPASRGTVLDAIARTVASAPNSSAVVDSVTAVTYRQLWDRAGSLAFELARHGAGPERPVGLLAGRSVAAATAIVAAWRCGAPYLGLDLTLPPERLERAGAQAGLVAWVVDSEGVGRVPTGQPFVRADWTHDENGADLPGDICPSSCAYLIATSGTTGQPKLVTVEHRNLMAYRDAFMLATTLAPGCRYALATGWATDLGLTMVVAALTTGGSLHLIPQPQLLVPDAFGQFIRQHEIEVLKITPSHLATLLAADATRSVLPSRLLVLGGEQPSWKLVQEIGTLSPGLRIFNHYGPTESTIGAVAGPIDPSQADRLARPPMGRALPTVNVYVMSEELRPVARWVPGQLYVGGRTVSRGYFGGPAATAAAFIPHPDSGERLYATGDQVRILGDGALEFLGRADRQVKINGFRCDPAEVESALAEIDGVQRAFVVARAQDARGIRLAAYVMPREGAGWNPSGLRRALTAKLPPHLIPASITALSSVPLKENGKLDVDRLPPETALTSSGELNQLERQIAAIWCEVLGLPAVGPDDRFFELGGQSLDLVQVRQRLKRELQLDLPLPELFNHPTVRATAALAAGRIGQDVMTPAQERAARQRAALATSPRQGARDATR